MAFRKAFNTDENFTSLDVVTAIHQFKLNYTKTKEFPMGESVSAPKFTVGGLNFQILYCPNGWVQGRNFIGLCFVLNCQSEVIVSLGVSLLDNQGKPAWKACQRLMCTFSPKSQKHGFQSLIERSDLEAHFLTDDYFTVVCSVTILNDSQKEVPQNFVNGIIPCSTNEHFAELLERKEMVDVTFAVDGECFTAHRLILSSRSPVFKAELFGEMAESQMKTIEIKGIKPVVFKAMLHFIYTDTLLNTCDEDIPFDTLVRHLLEAADRYALDGLKMICEERLTRDVSLDSVISSLALAEEHNCVLLKIARLDFAAEPENFLQLALKPEYVQLMQGYPSLLEDIGSFARMNGSYKNLISMKRKTW